MDKPTNPSEQSRGDANRRARSAARWAVALIRRHRVGAVITAALTCGVVAAPVVALAVSGPTRPAMVTTSPGPVTTTVPRQSTPTTAATPASSTTTAPPATTQVARAVTTPTTVRPESTTTTTALVCQDSYNPACGTFRWDPAPGPIDQSSVSISVDPPHPLAGQLVTFTVTLSDPDTSVTACGQIDFGDGIGQGCAAGTVPQCATRYGPWEPPAKTASTAEGQYQHTFPNTGSYTIVVRYPTGSPCYDPYQSSVTGSITVTVGPPTPSTPTTQP